MLNKLKYSLLCKIVAFILLVVFSFCTLFTLIGTGICFKEDFYIVNQQTITEEFHYETSERIAREVRDCVYFYEDGSMHFNKTMIDYEKISSMADFIVTDNNSNKPIFKSNNDFKDNYLSVSDINFAGDIGIRIYLKPFKNENIFSFKYSMLIGIYKNRFSLLVNTVICFAFSAVLFIFLLFSAGYKKGNKKIKISFLESIPFDIFTVFLALGIIFPGILTIELFDNLFSFLNNSLNFEPIFVYLIGIALLLLLCGSLFVIWSMSLAKRIRIKTAFKNCIITKFIDFLIKKVKSIFKFIKTIFKNLPFVWKTTFIILAKTLFELMVLFNGYIEYTVLFWVLEKVVLVPLTVFIAILLHKLKVGGEQISKGDINQKIDTEYMFWDFKEHADNLNSISDGISLAVEEKLKSERLKTELITNVSHDIKTPLTSVINYVDLIKKEEPENDKIKEYIEVLEKQSNRLKKLIEDLVEASKASSGNLSVELSPCDAQIVLEQAVGEYSEKFKYNNLELVLKKENSPINILVDGRYLWRIFDNLLNNICKYALAGSRVYLTLSKNNNIAEFSFKNISKYELDISPEELTERFVRSDKSRSTEGSGLGLSIAKSLTELQNGSFEIFTDGDLFKVIIKFKVL